MWLHQLDTRGNKVVFDCGKRNCSWKMHSQMCGTSKHVFFTTGSGTKDFSKVGNWEFPSIKAIWRWLFVLLLLLFCFVLVFLFLFFLFLSRHRQDVAVETVMWRRHRLPWDDGRPRSNCGSVSWHRGVWQQPQAACPAFKGSWRRLPQRWRELPNDSVSTAAEPAHFTKHGGGIEKKKIARDCQFFFHQ